MVVILFVLALSEKEACIVDSSLLHFCSHLTPAIVNNISICNPHMERTQPPMDCVDLVWLMILAPTPTKVIAQGTFPKHPLKGEFSPFLKFHGNSCLLTHLPSPGPLHYAPKAPKEWANPSHSCHRCSLNHEIISPGKDVSHSSSKPLDF